MLAGGQIGIMPFSCWLQTFEPRLRTRDFSTRAFNVIRAALGQGVTVPNDTISLVVWTMQWSPWAAVTMHGNHRQPPNRKSIRLLGRRPLA